MIAIKIAAAIGFAATAWYLAELFIFATKFRRDDEALWSQIGRPERFGISGQTKFLMVALGMKQLPPEAANRYKARFIRIRILLGLLLAAFVFLSISTASVS